MAESSAEPSLSVAQLLGGSRPGGLGRTILLDIALPWLAVRVLEGQGVAMVPAFAAAALFPLSSVLLAWIRRRRVDAVGILVVITLVLGVTLSLLSSDVRFSVVKAAPTWGLFGLACLCSLFARRPVMFFVARYFSTNGDPEKRAEWDARLAIPGFVRSMRFLTLVWGLAALSEAALGIASAFVLPPNVALVVEPLLAFAVLAALLFWTVAYGRRQSRIRGAQ